MSFMRPAARVRLNLVPPTQVANVIPLREDVYLLRAAIHEGVPLTTLLRALTRAGLSVTAVEDVGLVIHRIGQNATSRAPDDVVASHDAS